MRVFAMRRGACTLLMLLLVGVVCAGCDQDEDDRERCGEGASCNTTPMTAATSTFVSCEPVPRFRLDGIGYENRRFDDTVDAAEIGPVVGRIERVPDGVARCEPVTLEDGDGTWPAGTEIHQINGVDPATALAASLGNDVYLRFDATP